MRKLLYMTGIVSLALGAYSPASEGALLVDGSAVGLSVGKYFTPKGLSLAGVGVEPDVEIPMDLDTWTEVFYERIAPEDDPHIQAALELLK